MVKKLGVMALLALLGLTGCQVVEIHPLLELRVEPLDGPTPLRLDVRLVSQPVARDSTIILSGIYVHGDQASFVLTEPGRHTVQAVGVDYRGRPFKLEKEVVVFDFPTIENFTASATGREVTFNVSAKASFLPLKSVEIETGTGISLMVWLDDLMMWQGQISYVYPQTGSYTARLVVANAKGCKSTASLVLTLEEPTEESPEAPQD